jgi:hypothetical protein
LRNATSCLFNITCASMPKLSMACPATLSVVPRRKSNVMRVILLNYVRDTTSSECPFPHGVFLPLLSMSTSFFVCTRNKHRSSYQNSRYHSSEQKCTMITFLSCRAFRPVFQVMHHHRHRCFPEAHYCARFMIAFFCCTVANRLMSYCIRCTFLLLLPKVIIQPPLLGSHILFTHTPPFTQCMVMCCP